MDKKLAALAAEYGLTYTRYADDLTFSGDVFPKEQIIPRIKQIIRDEKFEPNHKKTRFINEYGIEHRRYHAKRYSRSCEKELRQDRK